MKLYDDTDLIYDKYIKKEFVSKVKIIDKIKKLEIEYNSKIENHLADYNEWIRYTAKVTILNELLESE